MDKGQRVKRALDAPGVPRPKRRNVWLMLCRTDGYSVGMGISRESCRTLCLERRDVEDEFLEISSEIVSDCN